MLQLFYITKQPEVAKIAEAAGVDRIFVDMEYIGKELRQPKMDTVKNRHTVEDVRNIRQVLHKAQLLVRINPIGDYSEQEINAVIEAGADVIMLPMWKSAKDVERFIELVDGRAKTLPLLETDEARRNLDSVLLLYGVDEIHIGLNDLYLSQHKHMMFELFADGTVDEIVNKIKPTGIPFGIGGVGAVGKGLAVPAELVLAEHYRLGSSMAILARAFCNTEQITDLAEIRQVFESGIKENRVYEAFLSEQDESFFERKHQELTKVIAGLMN